MSNTYTQKFVQNKAQFNSTDPFSWSNKRRVFITNLNKCLLYFPEKVVGFLPAKSWSYTWIWQNKILLATSELQQDLLIQKISHLSEKQMTLLKDQFFSQLHNKNKNVTQFWTWRDNKK